MTHFVMVLLNTALLENLWQDIDMLEAGDDMNCQRLLFTRNISMNHKKSNASFLLNQD